MTSSDSVLITLLFVVLQPICAEKNVYGKDLAKCGNGSLVCPYRKSDRGQHEVCVKALPHEFSYKTGQGRWSDIETGKPWCICIWAYSNYVLNYGDDDLPVVCDAVPEKVLISSYALESFRSCGARMSRCSSYDRAIERMCNHCIANAPDAAGNESVQQKCNEIRAAANGSANSYAQETLESTVDFDRRYIIIAALAFLIFFLACAWRCFGKITQARDTGALLNNTVELEIKERVNEEVSC